MKIISSILILFCATNLFAQNKHSELYNKVDSIYKANVKPSTDTTNSGTRIELTGKIKQVERKPLLVIDGIPRDFEILDSMNLNSIVSINFLSDNISSCRPIYGVIVIQTKDGYEKQLNTKKKKRKSKHN